MLLIFFSPSLPSFVNIFVWKIGEPASVQLKAFLTARIEFFFCSYCCLYFVSSMVAFVQCDVGIAPMKRIRPKALSFSHSLCLCVCTVVFNGPSSQIEKHQLQLQPFTFYIIL